LGLSCKSAGFSKLQSMKILYLDLETTGLDTSRDRVVEIGMVLEDEDTGQKESLESLVNPGMPIPAEVTAIHGIKDADVKNQPSLAQVLPKIKLWVEGCDVLAGYNVSFDLKVLMAEARRVSIPLSLHTKRIWDMQKIFFHHEPRNLSAAMKFYCDREIEGAHRALNDVEATREVFLAQRKRYNLDMESKEVMQYTQLSLPLDSNGAFIVSSSGKVEILFGKFKGKEVDVTKQEIKNYLSWMIGANFPPDTKALARAMLKGKAVGHDNLEAVIMEHSA